MTKKRNNPSTVPQTPIEKPSIVSLNKSQKDLFLTKARELNERIKRVIEEYGAMRSEILGKLVDVFIEELQIDIVSQNWEFDAEKLRFIKKEK